MDEIPWDTLKIAFGPYTAEGIPAALEQLQAPDPLVRQQAWSQIESVVVQGYLSEAAPFTALELLSRLRQGLVIDKQWAYGFLFEIGHQGFDSGEEQVSLSGGRRERLPLVCRQVMESGLDVYLPDLLAADPVLRDLAIDLVCACGLRKQEAQQALQTALERAPTEELRRSIERQIQSWR